MLPTVDNTHEIAQRLAPESRIVYVDNDPIVLAHARTLLTGTREGVTDYIDADIHHPDAIVRRASDTLDFEQPVAVMMLGILNFVLDTGQAQDIVRRIMASVPSGSYLVLTHPTTDPDLDGEGNIEAMKFWNENATPPITARPRAEVAAFLERSTQRNGRICRRPVHRRVTILGLLVRHAGPGPGIPPAPPRRTTHAPAFRPRARGPRDENPTRCPARLRSGSGSCRTNSITRRRSGGRTSSGAAGIPAPAAPSAAAAWDATDPSSTRRRDPWAQAAGMGRGARIAARAHSRRQREATIHPFDSYNSLEAGQAGRDSCITGAPPST